MLLRADPGREQVNPDVIFLDVEMPGMDGLTLVEQIRAHPELRGIEVVIVTGIELSEAQLEAVRRGGAHSLIFKTNNIMEMAQAIQIPLERILPTVLSDEKRGIA